MKLAASPSIEPGNHRLTLVRTEPATGRRRGETCLRWTWATPDGVPYIEFTPARFGRRSNARKLLEAAAGRPLPDEVDTEAFHGKEIEARLIQHPNGDWRRRIAEARPTNGAAVGGLLAGAYGQSWDDLAAAAEPIEY